MHDYTTAAEYLGRKADRPLSGRATRLRRRSASTIAVCYHGTDVVTYCEDGSIVLNSGGWRSVTTKARIVEYSRAHLGQKAGIWYFWNRETWTPESLYYDGVILEATGIPRDPKPITEDRTDRQLQREITRYIRGFAAMIAAGDLQDPSPGDCWGCAFTLEQKGDPVKGAKPDPTEASQITGINHLVSHLKERYYVPSLLWRAFTERQYQDPGFIWSLTKAQKDPSHAVHALRAFFRIRRPALLRAWTEKGSYGA